MEQADTENGLRILILEDTPTDAELMEYQLRKGGVAFVSQRVDRRAAFVQALETFRPSLILSDFHLPDIDGMEVLQIVLRDYPEVPVIMVTGALPDIEAVELIHAGARDYVLKDRLARLAPAVQRVMLADQATRARKEAEKALIESYRQAELARDEWNSAFDAVHSPIFLHDHEFRITRCNRAYAERAGLPFKQIIGRVYWEVFPRLDGPLPHCLRAMRLEKDEETEEIRQPGGEIFVSRSFPVMDKDGGYLFSLHLMDDITERKRSEQKIINLTRLYAMLSHTNTTIVRARDREELFHSICQGAVEHGKFILAWVGFADQATGMVTPFYQYGSETDYVADIEISVDDVPRGRGPTGVAIRENRVCYVNDFAHDERVQPWRAAAIARGFNGAASIPLRFNGKAIGALTLYSGELNFFDAEQIELLEEMTMDISFALDGLEREALRRKAEEERETALNKLQLSLESSIQIAASITEMRDPYTSGHQQRVARLATAIAQELKLAEEMVKGIHFGAMIHDIGKISIPAEILSKPSRLSDLEYSLIKAHSRSGYDILKEIDFPWPIAQMVIQHHERMDGTGYPDGLAGEAIILEARIIAVADVVEAISSHRPYRPGLGIEVALEEIESNRGSRYDKDVVDACVDLIRNRGYDVLQT